MPFLSENCHKWALENSTCTKKATELALKDCAGVSGPGKGNCMDARFRARLAEVCADIVCPNDPNRYAVPTTATTVKTNLVNATDERGMFDKIMTDFSVDSSQSTAEETRRGGVDPAKMTQYILAGAAVIAVIFIAKSTLSR